MMSMDSAPSNGSFSARFPRLDPDVATLLDGAAALGLPPLVSLTPAEARDRVNAGTSTRVGILKLAEANDLRIGPDGLPGRLYRPPHTRSDVVVVYFHGGGWVTGDLGYSDEICRLIAARARCWVVSVDYRLAPENAFPAAIDDALQSVSWIASGGLGRPARVVVAGDSAGGGLAAVCAQQSRSVIGQVLLYAALDTDVNRPSYQRNSGILIGVDEMSWFFDHYVPALADRTDPRFAVFRGQVADAPTALVVVAGHDPLHDEGLAYAEVLAEAGVDVAVREFPSMPHGFLRFTTAVPAAASAADDVAELVAELISRLAPGGTG